MELGDLIMHIVFYALIGKEQEQFEHDRCLTRYVPSYVIATRIFTGR